MAMTPEAKVKKRVREMLDKLGIYHFSPPGMGLGRAGIPDIIACYNGHFVAIECKAGTNKPTPLQERELNRIMNAGGEAFVVNEDNITELHERLLWMDK
jgi:Holliday junction resolvase